MRSAENQWVISGGSAWNQWGTSGGSAEDLRGSVGDQWGISGESVELYKVQMLNMFLTSLLATKCSLRYCVTNKVHIYKSEFFSRLHIISNTKGILVVLWCKIKITIYMLISLTFTIELFYCN